MKLKIKNMEVTVLDEINKEQECIDFLERLGYTVIPPQTRTMESVLQKWLDYKKEKHQTYKPRGLAALKKKLLELSGGNVEMADAIVEQSMACNYAGLFPLKQDNYAARRQNVANKLTAILGR